MPGIAGPEGPALTAAKALPVFIRVLKACHHERIPAAGSLFVRWRTALLNLAGRHEISSKARVKLAATLTWLDSLCGPVDQNSASSVAKLGLQRRTASNPQLSFSRRRKALVTSVRRRARARNTFSRTACFEHFRISAISS